MKSTLTVSIFFFSLLLVSCSQLVNNGKAIKLNNQGLAHSEVGNFDEAIKDFKEAIELKGIDNSTRVSLHRNLALAYEANYEPDSAIRHFTKSAELSLKGSYDWYINQASAKLAAGEIDTAIEYLREATELNSDDFAVHNELGLIYMGEYGEDYIDYERALKHNEKAYRGEPSIPTKINLAMNYQYLEKYEEAEALIKQIIEEAPDIPYYKFALGMNQYLSGAEEDGEELMLQAVGKDSSLYIDYILLTMDTTGWADSGGTDELE